MSVRWDPLTGFVTASYLDIALSASMLYSGQGACDAGHGGPRRQPLLEEQSVCRSRGKCFLRRPEERF